MKPSGHFTLFRDANRLLLAIEQAVRHFDASRPRPARSAQPAVAQMRSRRIGPRYHKYTLGTDLRRQAMSICQLVRRAAPRNDDQAERVTRVVEAVDDLKLQIQLGKKLQAFESFKQFQSITELAVAVGKWPLSYLKGLGRGLRKAYLPYLFAAEKGYLPGGMKARVLRYLHIGSGARVLLRVARVAA